MKLTPLYHFLAAISDIYFLSMAIGACLAFGVSLFHFSINPILSIFVLLGVVCISIVYHTLVAKRVHWLSPGEIMFGRTIQDDHKVWQNPYGVNRAGLFILMLVNLFPLGNLWDRVFDGYPYTMGNFAYWAFLSVLLSAGLLRVGKGKLGGIGYIVAFHIFIVSQLLNAKTTGDANNRLEVVIWFYIGFIGVHGLAALVYSVATKQRSARQETEMLP